MMIYRIPCWKKARSATQQAKNGRCQRQPTYSFSNSASSPMKRHETDGKHPSSDHSVASKKDPSRSAANIKQLQRAQNREFMISVLESSATKRDAKAYIQTFGPIVSKAWQRKLPSGAHTAYGEVQGGDESRTGLTTVQEQYPLPDADLVPHVAVVKFRKPQCWHDFVLRGVLKTLIHLRDLGLLSVVVVDCDLDAGKSDWRRVEREQQLRIVEAFYQLDAPARLVNPLSEHVSMSRSDQSRTPASDCLVVTQWESFLLSPLEAGDFIILTCSAFGPAMDLRPVRASGFVHTLVRYFAGLQPGRSESVHGSAAYNTPKALVEKVILLDPLGGIPSRRRGGASVFLNLEDEFDRFQTVLGSPAFNAEPKPGTRKMQQEHLDNLVLARDALAILPSTSSAVITSPEDAALRSQVRSSGADGQNGSSTPHADVGLGKQNPLIHNLLTDRPIYSSSLPVGRIKARSQEGETMHTRMPTSTLLKRGMPVTIFPDPRVTPWERPSAGSRKIRLTDDSVDLARLVHLINDSFGRKLHVENYLQRVSDSLAGIIIAGEYEGGAILTWEKPPGLDKETAHKTGRFVPYLDKFAVLRRSQGAGGVADVVFNAMVLDCFPQGVCWRSRRNNPVNKWYFERSRGTWKLAESNWAMFWTTPGLPLNEQMMKDYEAVCRSVEPSWVDEARTVDGRPAVFQTHAGSFDIR